MQIISPLGQTSSHFPPYHKMFLSQLHVNVLDLWPAFYDFSYIWSKCFLSKYFSHPFYHFIDFSCFFIFETLWHSYGPLTHLKSWEFPEHFFTWVLLVLNGISCLQTGQLNFSWVVLWLFKDPTKVFHMSHRHILWYHVPLYESTSSWQKQIVFHSQYKCKPLLILILKFKCQFKYLVLSK